MSDIDMELLLLPKPYGASQRVYLGIMQDLEAHRMVPGQRLIESELAQRFGVGRNAVREAIQRLAARGIVDPRKNRSPSIRILDEAETHEILDVASVMTGLVARTAALRFDPIEHGDMLASTMQTLNDARSELNDEEFNRARRRFYRALLLIGANRELYHIFPTISMQVIYFQFQSPILRNVRLADYKSIYHAILARNPRIAELAGRKHVERVRSLIEGNAVNKAITADARGFEALRQPNVAKRSRAD